MSHYNHTKLPIKSRALLLEALTNKKWGLGYDEKDLDLTENRQLEGYHGDKRKDRADITIPRRHLTGASNDIGFKKNPDGSWTLIESDYDSGMYGGRQSTSGGAMRHFKKRFVAAYATAKVKKLCQKNRKKIRSSQIVGNKLRIRVGA
jgi:hypothetical protein